MAYDQTNRGALFKNDKKRGENDPDYTGSGNIEGQDIWMSAWIKTSESGMKYMSVSYKPKDAAPKAAPKQSQGGRQAMDDDIPFASVASGRAWSVV